MLFRFHHRREYRSQVQSGAARLGRRADDAVVQLLNVVEIAGVTPKDEFDQIGRTWQAASVGGEDAIGGPQRFSPRSMMMVSPVTESVVARYTTVCATSSRLAG